MAIAVPNPGSPAAKDRGCECAVVDNHYGKGIPNGSGEPWFWLTESCPLHGEGTGYLPPVIREQVEESLKYVARGAEYCPNCKMDEASYLGTLEMPEDARGIAVITKGCTHCHATWDELYFLAGFARMCVPDKEQGNG